MYATKTQRDYDSIGPLERLKKLEQYEGTIARLFPTVPRGWSISKGDALSLGYFLDCFPHKVVVLDIGTFVGMSAFYFATHPKVVEVLSVDPNPPLMAELHLSNYGISDAEAISLRHGPRRSDTDSLHNLRPLQIAQAVLAEFNEERQKIQLREGVVGSTNSLSLRENFLSGSEKIEVPVLKSSDGASLVAFVDGLHTEEGVQADLEAIFEKNTNAVAVLHDCRGPWGTYVQAGITDFIKASTKGYHFHLLEPLGPGLKPPSLGIVYSDTAAAEVESVLVEFYSFWKFLRRAILLELQTPGQFLERAVTLIVPTLYNRSRRALRDTLLLHR